MVFLDEIRGRGTTKDIYRPSNLTKSNPLDDYSENSNPYSLLITNYNFRIVDSGLLGNSHNGSFEDIWLENKTRLPKDESSIPELEDSLSNELTLQDQLSSPVARSILAGFADILADWVIKYGEQANKTFRKEPIKLHDLPKSTQDLLNKIYYQFGLEQDFPEVPPELAIKIGEYTAKQLIDAIPFASVSGEVMSQSHLEYRFRFGYKYQDSYEFLEKTFYFMAFGTKWYPSWQFHCLRGDTWDGMGEVMANCRNRDFSIIDILGWSNRPSHLLEDLSPAEWISLGRSAEKVLPTISDYDKVQMSLDKARTWYDQDFDGLETMCHPAEHTKMIETLSSPLATITTNMPALLQFRGFMKSLAEMDNTDIGLKIDPQTFGKQVSKKTMSSYFQSQAFNHVILSFFKNSNGSLTVVNENTIDWLGTQTARYMYSLTNRMAIIGSTLNEAEVLDILNSSSRVTLSQDYLIDLKEKNQLISIEVMDEELYPSWQIDQERHQIRPIVRTLLPLLESQDAYVNPYAVMAWANDPETEYLDGILPAEWIIRIEDSAEEMVKEKAALWDAAKVLVQRYFY